MDTTHSRLLRTDSHQYRVNYGTHYPIARSKGVWDYLEWKPLRWERLKANCCRSARSTSLPLADGLKLQDVDGVRLPKKVIIVNQFNERSQYAPNP